ncbi:MAG: decaprenyl-phosphate phosphoribosyltransferase [Mediterranea massiliensis]|nr:decaprenyl-phosphate phosphoribosyltransferase [Mediterranea massiliensis]
MKQLIHLLRPQQWLKNLFVLMPLFFGGELLNFKSLSASLITFVVFCLVASGIYCINDVKDIASDRLHPIKCNRPVASGAISPLYAILTSIFLLCTSIFVATISIGIELVYILIAYILINIAYCFWIKQFALVDVFIISIGFILRLMAGSIATHIVLSHWIVLMTFLLALFLALAKRRDDVIMFEKEGKQMRKNISRYNLLFLDTTISITVSITLVCYLMYTVSDDVASRINSPYIYLTSLFVFLGMYRYLQITIVEKKSGSPTKILLKDSLIQICIACWILSFIFILYL